MSQDDAPVRAPILGPLLGQWDKIAEVVRDQRPTLSDCGFKLLGIIKPPGWALLGVLHRSRVIPHLLELSGHFRRDHFIEPQAHRLSHDLGYRDYVRVLSLPFSNGTLVLLDQAVDLVGMCPVIS